jgi:hypothetical protein
MADMVRQRHVLLLEGQKAIASMLIAYFRQRLNGVCNRVEEGLGKAVPLPNAGLDAMTGLKGTRAS